MKKFLQLFTLILLAIFWPKAGLAYDFADWSDEDAVDIEDVGGIMNGRVALEGEFLDGDILKISVMAEEMLVPVLGIAYDLFFEEEKLSFLRYEPGTFLEKGGDPFYLVEGVPGRIIFGETLRRSDDFPVGGAKVVDFYFQILSEEGFDFRFESGVVSTLDVVRQDLDEIEWRGLELERDLLNHLGNYEEPVLTTQIQNIGEGNNWKRPLSYGLIGALTSSFLVFIFLKKRSPRSVNFK